MKLLQNRAVAAVIAVLVVVLSTSWSINRALGEYAGECREAWEEDYGLGEQLKYRGSAATQLLSVLSDYEALSGECDAMRRACDAFYAAQGPAELYQANASITSASQTLWAAAGELRSLAQRDRENGAYYYGLLENAQRVIEDSEYNQEVEEYHELLSTFPLRLLRILIRVDTPEYFHSA